MRDKIDRSIDRFVPFVLLTDRSIGEQDIKGKRGRKAKVHKSFPFIFGTIVGLQTKE
jgi:hypothetical protein